MKHWFWITGLVFGLTHPLGAADTVVSQSGSNTNTNTNTSGVQSNSKSAPDSEKAKIKPNAGKVLLITPDPEREAAALSFVKQHHPELAELLTHLKESSPKEFERAIRDLYRASERLAQIQERDSISYELELGLWKARSRAQLLSARLHMADDDGIRKELRATLTEEYDLRVRIAERDREKVSERVKALDEQIDRLRTQRDKTIENQFQSMTKNAGTAAGSKAASGKPGKPANGKTSKKSAKPPESTK